MQEVFIILSLVAFVCSLLFWQLSSCFINWFWKDAQEEAEMILADQRASLKSSTAFSLKSSLLTFLVFAIFTAMLFHNEASTEYLIIKFLACTYLLFIGMVDLRSYILPDILNYIGLWLFLLVASYGLNPFGITVNDSIVGAFSSYMVCWLVIQFGYKILNVALMGHGDAKSLAMIGSIFGFKVSYLIFSLSVFLACIFYLGRMIFLKDGTYKKALPFGPFLSSVTMIMIIYFDLIIGYIKMIYPI